MNPHRSDKVHFYRSLFSTAIHTLSIPLSLYDGRSGNLAPLRPAIPMCGGMLTPAIALIHKANSMAYKKAVVDA